MILVRWANFHSIDKFVKIANIERSLFIYGLPDIIQKKCEYIRNSPCIYANKEIFVGSLMSSGLAPFNNITTKKILEDETKMEGRMLMQGWEKIYYTYAEQFLIVMEYMEKFGKKIILSIHTNNIRPEFDEVLGKMKNDVFYMWEENCMKKLQIFLDSSDIEWRNTIYPEDGMAF